MQPPTAPPRDALTVAQVAGLIQGPATLLGGGTELIGKDLTVAAVLDNDLLGGTVSRASYATKHGTASLKLSRPLPWGSAIVRPYATLTDGIVTARFNLGAYYTGTPVMDLADGGPLWTVEGQDILALLDDPVGDWYTLSAGTGYLAAVEQILLGRGWTAYLIDQQSAALVLPVDRVWAFDDRTTWLQIVNDLLGSIGYQGIWSDWDGRLRCTPYTRPVDRSPEWTYTTDPTTGMIGTKRQMIHDYAGAPNRWVFYRTNNLEGTPPVEGDGKYTFVNQNVGDTSVAARGGRIITKPVGLDVADHNALLTRAQSTIDADINVGTTFPVETLANPLHWHFDRVYVEDPQLGPPFDALVTSWTLALGAATMTAEWSLVQ